MRSFFSCLLLLLLISCAKQYSYELLKPEGMQGLHPDSLRWKYAGAKIMEIPVMASDGRAYWLKVDPGTKLELTTTDNEMFRFYIESIRVEDQGEGPLGATTAWRGYDTRQHAERSVMLREVTDIRVISGTPATTLIVR